MFTKNILAIQHCLDTLNEKSRDAAIIVEGKNDIFAMQTLLRDDVNFFKINENERSLYGHAEKISSQCKKAVLLLDSDRKGKELAKRFKIYLQQNGVSVDSRTGYKLLKLADCAHVEGLKQLNRLL